MNRKKVALAILLIALLLSLIYSVSSQPKAKRAGVLKYKGSGPTSKAQTALPFSSSSSARVDDTKVNLAGLDKEYPRYSGIRRNIFSPIFQEDIKPESKPAPGKINLPVPPPPPLAPPPPPAPPVPQVPEITPVQRDMAKFTFLGFLKKDNKKTIFLSSDKEIFLVKKGDTIAGKYQVTNLTDEALTIQPLADGGEIIIPLVENKTLAAPRR